MRLVDVDVIIKDLTAMKRVYDAIELDGMIKALKEAPTIEAEPVQHGEWILDFLSPYRRNHYKCSACGKRSAKSSLYCPECGAKMDKEG